MSVLAVRCRVSKPCQEVLQLDRTEEHMLADLTSRPPLAVITKQSAVDVRCKTHHLRTTKRGPNSWPPWNPGEMLWNVPLWTSPKVGTS